MKRSFICRLAAVFFFSVIGLSSTGLARTDAKKALTSHISHIIDTSRAKVGVAVVGLDFHDTILLNGSRKYPMQSVYKLPVAMAILHDVDAGKVTLEQNVHISRSKLDMDTWSPMLDNLPEGDVDMTVGALLKYMVSGSDNNACDILFWLAGGTEAVNNYVHGLGVKDIEIAATEAEMHLHHETQYTNWCRPLAMASLLGLVQSGNTLKPASRALLLKMMTDSDNSPNRIKGLLPASAVVAHKTGTSFTDKRGVTAAINDVGIVTLPNGRHIALVVYVSDCKGVQKGEHVIAEIAKAVWEYYADGK